MAMQNGNQDIEEDIFEQHMNEIDERETPRWEMSEEEPDDGSETPPMLSHVPVAKQPINLPNPVELPVFNGAVGVPARTSGAVNPSSSSHPDTRVLAKNYPRGIHKNGLKLPGNISSSKEIVENGYDDDDDFEKDSVKDFGGAFREQEAKYMERTSEAIYNRAAAEHIRQPNPYEDDDQDSVKNFGGASQGISRVPSDENLCLSPPWLEEEDGQVPEESIKDVLVENKDINVSEGNEYKMNELLVKATSRADYGTNYWQVEEALDFTKNFGKLENSSRPSSENISLTPPWEDTDVRDSAYKEEDTQATSKERPAETPLVQTTGVVTPRVLTTTNTPTSQPALLTANADVKPTRYQDNVVSTSNLYSTSRTQSTPSDPTFPSNPPRTQRRITPPGNSTTLVPNAREGLAPAITIKSSTPRDYGYQNPVVAAPYRANNPYNTGGYYPGPRVPRAQTPGVGFPRPAAMATNVRPYPDMQYYRVPPNRFPSSDPTYSRMQPAGNVPAFNPFRENTREDGYHMSTTQPRQAVRHPAGGHPFYSQPAIGRWPYQPGNQIRMEQHSLPGYRPRFEPANFAPTGQREFPGMHLYPEMSGENIMSDSDVSPVMSTRCDSQSSLAVYCHTPHQDGLETASVMSFASGPSTHQDLDSKIEQVRNLLAVIDNHKELAQTLYSLSNSKDNCEAMRQCGCLPLLIKLQHRTKASDDPRGSHEIRVRSAQAMRNIVTSSAEDKRGRRELRVLKLLEMVRSYCVQVRFMRKRSVKERVLEQALAAIMKLSFEEEHRTAIGQLGGVQAIGEFLELAHARGHRDDNDMNDENHQDSSPNPSLCKYASMTLTNMTFGNTRNKRILGNALGIVRAILSDLTVLTDEDLIQVSASVLRNLSCKPDDASKKVFQQCSACAALMSAAQHVNGEPALRTILLAIWNLSAHSSGNKTELCECPGGLVFLVKMLAYKSASNSLSVVESAGGILRNLSSHVAVKSEYRATLREEDCFSVLLCHLRSPSLRVVSNACGILWNLSARCVDDQELLWRLNAVPLLKSLVSSKNKTIAKGAGAALKNLQNFKTSKGGAVSQSPTFRESPSSVRKPSGSPAQSRTRPDFPTTSVSSRPKDVESLNSFTGSVDDMVKETTRKTSKGKLESQNGDLDSGQSRPKGVRWAIDEKRSAKLSSRKTSTGERKKYEASLEQETPCFLVSGNDGGSCGDLGKRDDVPELTSAMTQLGTYEKSRSNSVVVKKAERSPKIKKKSNAKSKKKTDAEDLDVDNTPSAHALNGQPIRSAVQPSKHTPSSARRVTHPEVQRSDKNPARFNGKQGTSRNKENIEEYTGEDTEVPRSDTSGDDSPRSRNIAKNVRKKSSDENNDEKGAGVSHKKMADIFGTQKCQCPEETGVWVKRSKRCERCQRRRMSHSSESAGGSRRSSCESLPTTNRTPARSESTTNSTGYVTTL